MEVSVKSVAWGTSLILGLSVAPHAAWADEDDGIELEASADVDADADEEGEEEGDDGDDDKFLSGEVGAGVGIGIPTAGLGVGPDVFIEGGVALRLGPGSLTGGLRVGFQTYSTDAEGALPCPSPNACVQPDAGRYTYDLNEQLVRIGIPVGYRFLPPDTIVVPYVTIIPALFLLRATSTAFESENEQTDTQPGVHALAGAQLRLGPGALHLEAGYQYAPIEHSIMGDTSLSSVLITLGYRFIL
jgi:hypothetical protein